MAGSLIPRIIWNVLKPTETAPPEIDQTISNSPPPVDPGASRGQSGDDHGHDAPVTGSGGGSEDNGSSDDQGGNSDADDSGDSDQDDDHF